MLDTSEASTSSPAVGVEASRSSLAVQVAPRKAVSFEPTSTVLDRRSSSSSSSSSSPSKADDASDAQQAADSVNDDDDDPEGGESQSSSSSSPSVEVSLTATMDATTEWHPGGSGGGRSSDLRDDHDDDPRHRSATVEEERRGATIAAIALLVALSLFVAILSSSSYARAGASRRGGPTTTDYDRIPTAEGVIGGYGNDKFVVGEEELDMMEEEGDLYYYDDDRYDDDEAYYESEIMEDTAAAEDDYIEREEVEDQEELPITVHSTSTRDGTMGLVSQESGEAIVRTSGVTTAEMTGPNDRRECSVLLPVDYNSKFQWGTGYAGFPGYECYRTVEGTRRTVDNLLAKYPSLTSKSVLADYQTVEKGQRLQVFKITNKNKVASAMGKGKMLVVSSIHARELSTGETMMRFAEYLLQQYEIDPDVTWIVDYTEIHLIFHANPDGRTYLETGGDKTLWKKNRNKGTCASALYGVDPNRNFPFKWGQCITTDDNRCSSSTDCSSVVYRGPAAASETETKAILNYAKSIFPDQQRKGNVAVSENLMNVPFAEDSEGIFIDVHSHGRYIGWPWGFANQRTPNNAGLGSLGRKFASYGNYSLWAPKTPNRKYGFDGSTIDTMYGLLGVASFFFEIGTSFYQTCDTLPDVINEVFPMLLHAAKVAKMPYKNGRGPDILCTTITSTQKGDGKYIVAKIQVSDGARTENADDIGFVFPTGRQTIKAVEIYVNCHPLYSVTSCQPRVRRVLTSAGTSTTVTMQFKAPNKINNVMYVRAIDSEQYAGPITAHKFVGG